MTREEIKNSTLPQAEPARIYNVTRQTIRKWQDRESPPDGSHCPKTLNTSLSPEQELIVVELRKTLLLPTDDLLAITREFINPAVSRAGLGRCAVMAFLICAILFLCWKAINHRPRKPSRITNQAISA